MPLKYVRRDGVPLLLRHTGPTTLPERPPQLGRSVAIVCLHDAGLQGSVFSELLDLLDASDGDAATASGSRDGDSTAAGAIAFDLPGHGRSGSLDALPDIGAMAEMAAWIAAWCGIERALLLGHGMGALVALEWARSRADQVTGVVLCGAGRTLGVDDEAIERMRLVSQGKAPRPFDPSRLAPDASPDLMRRAYMEGIRTDPRATLGDLEACRSWIASGVVDSLSLGGRVEAICGASEASECRERTRALVERLGGGEPHSIDRAAQLLPLERPDALAELLGRLREAA